MFDVERQHRMTADWRFTVHLTLPISISTPFFSYSHPLAFLSVCLNLSVDSGGVVMSTNRIFQCIKSLHKVLTCEEWDWEFRFSYLVKLCSCERAQRYWGQSLSVMSSSCQKRNTYFKFVQIWIILKHLYPLYILNVYITYIFCFRTKKKNLFFPISHIGQFDYRNALLFFQVLVNINKSVFFCFTYKLPLSTKD